MAQQPAGPPGRPMPRQPDASHRQATSAGGVLGLLPDPSRRTKSGSTGRRLIADSFASGSAATGPAMDQADSRLTQWPLSAQVEAQVQAKRESAAAAAAQGRGGSKTAVGRSRPRKLDDDPAALARRESKSGAGVTRAGSVSFTAAAAPSDARRAQTAAEQRVREDMLKVRDEYFATLQESAGRVELAMAAIDRYSAAEVRREEQEEDEDEDEDEESGSGEEEEEEGKYPMEGTVRLTARGRSERLMKRLQTEEAVAQLAEVTAWLEDAGSERDAEAYELKLVQSERAAEAARKESELVLQGLDEREAMAKRRLAAFGKTLGSFSAEKAARDEVTRKAKGSMASLPVAAAAPSIEAQMAQLEMTVGALRAQLLRREEQARKDQAEGKRRPPPAAAPPTELAQTAQTLVSGSEEEDKMTAQLIGLIEQQEARLEEVNRKVAAAAVVSKHLRAVGAASTMEVRRLAADHAQLSGELAAVAEARQKEAPDMSALKAAEEERCMQARLDAVEMTRQQLSKKGEEAREKVAAVLVCHAGLAPRTS